MDVTEYKPGTPSWVDIGVPDVDAAVAFYSGLFGWDIPEGLPETGGYRIAHSRGLAVAGLGPQMTPGPSYWTTYVDVDSADDAAAKIRDAGGTIIVEPMDVVDVGRMAVAFDPTGAAVSVWQAGTHIGALVVNEPGSFCWNELNTRDVAASTAFYSSVFGWTAHAMDGPMPYTEWLLDGQAIGGMMPMPPEVPADVPSHWLVYFAVADCDATVAKAEKLGGSVMMAAMDAPPGRFAVLGDLGGAAFGAIQLAES